MIPISTLLNPISKEDLLTAYINALEVQGIPASSWRDGSVPKTVLAVFALFMSLLYSLLVFAASANFLAFGTGDGLTNHAEDVYNVIRIPATFASGTVTLTNASAVPYSYAANQLIVKSTRLATGTDAGAGRFLVTDAVNLPANASINVAVRAINAGAASSVSPGDINALETTLNGVTVTNAKSIIGTDEETDDELRARCAASKGTFSVYAPRGAYVAAVRRAKLDDGTFTSIKKVSVSPSSSTGIVSIVCATPTGTPSDDELAASRLEVENTVRPDTVTVNLTGAVTADTAHNITLYARGGNQTQIILNAQRALNNLVALYPIGGQSLIQGGPGYLFADDVKATVIGSSPEVYHAVIQGGDVDIPLAANAVAVNATVFSVVIIPV